MSFSGKPSLQDAACKHSVRCWKYASANGREGGLVDGQMQVDQSKWKSQSENEQFVTQAPRHSTETLYRQTQMQNIYEIRRNEISKALSCRASQIDKMLFAKTRSVFANVQVYSVERTALLMSKCRSSKRNGNPRSKIHNPE